MKSENLARQSVLSLRGTLWGDPLPDNSLRLQFSEMQEVFPPVLRALRKEVASVNLYPDIAKIEQVRTLIGRRERLSAKNVFLGSGVDSLIDVTARIFCDENDEVLLPAPTYPCYADAVRFMGASVILQPLEDDFSLDFDAFAARITPRTKLIFLANPNNPTGNILLSVPQIEKLLRKFRGMLAVDEEYFDFSGISAVRLLGRYDNLLIFRGYSKSFGIAGLRFGAVFGSEAAIRLFENSQGATQVFEVNRLALAAAEAIVRNPAAAGKFVRKFLAQKRDFESALRKIPAVNILPSSTSFTIFSTPLPADELRGMLLERKIAMKSMSLYDFVPKNLLITAIPPRNQFGRVLTAVKESLVFPPLIP